MNPKAVKKLKNGSIYHGTRLNGKPTGIGFIAVFDDDKVLESVYLGNFLNGKAQDYGTLIYESGQSRVAGEWHQGKYWDENGHYKKEYLKDGTLETVEYRGGYIFGKMSGYGTFTWPSGNSYYGQWKNNLRHGTGKVYDSQGVVQYEGTWDKGELKQEVPCKIEEAVKAEVK